MARVVIVSNRLPVSVKKVEGKLQFYDSAGGLATGLSGQTKDKNSLWVGWPGIVSEDLNDAEKEEIALVLAKQNCYPIFLTRKQIQGFYDGYSNSVLWPYFHNMPMDDVDVSKIWQSYRQVNQLFADAVLGISSPDSIVWVHDYQLLLVPGLLRTERPYELIGFFLHIPFPPAKKFKSLEQSKSLIKGLLGSDLIGFHTDEYVQDFLESCRELNIGTVQKSTVSYLERSVRITDFPLGIDYTKFSRAGKSLEVKEHVRKHRKKYGRKKVILTVDRLDPTKGLVERLRAYEELLQSNKRLRKKVVLVMLAIPSRTNIPAYSRLKLEVENLVSEINAKYGKRRWKPVHYMYQTVPFEELAAMYRIADVAFIAPIKDGMNLVAKEYIASQPDMKGILVLSETAGAAKELTEALMVNPNLPTTMVDGLKQALNMRPAELQERVKLMRRSLATNTVHHWKRKFVGSLQSSYPEFQKPVLRLNNLELDKMINNYSCAARACLILDYDGVLAPFVTNPAHAKPTQKIIELLQTLAKQSKGGVLVISGRKKSDLEDWLGELPITLAAEHGARLKLPASKAWQKIVDTPSYWQELIMPVLQKYADKTPGAHVERKEASLVWHYRNASTYYSQKNRTILQRVLKPYLKKMRLNMYTGNMILEIKSPDANKGKATKYWLDPKHDFILAIGDDYTDEDIFAALPQNAYTVKVGRGKTLARYRVNSVDEVYQMLEKLVSPR